MSTLFLLVGPPGSGKSTWANDQIMNGGDHGAACAYINQDSQGKEGHFKLFTEALHFGKDIIVDRMNFSKEQRNRYLIPAKEKGYRTKIIVLHENKQKCFDRCKARENHETIKTAEQAMKALEFFFKKYEKVEDSEADEVEREYNQTFFTTPDAIICDLDGTLCNIDHRLHFVQKEGKKDWQSFFEELVNDTPNEWCLDILAKFTRAKRIVFCSGRPEDHYLATRWWLDTHLPFDLKYDLYMRPKGDFRPDNLVKENLLDFEILTRYKPYFWIDDRQQVVDQIRSRGIVVLQCAPGNF